MKGKRPAIKRQPLPRVIRKRPAGQNGDNQKREVLQLADIIIATNLQDFPWAPTLLAMQLTCSCAIVRVFELDGWMPEKWHQLHIGFLCNSNLCHLEKQSGRAGKGRDICHLALQRTLLVAIAIFSPSVKCLGKGRDQLNGQLQMQMRERELKS